MTKALISIVDDDESIRRTTVFLIESFGFRAVAFENSESFLKSPHLHDTSCLLVDIQMPGMNGLQLQRELAVAGHAIPIIFITAFDNRDTRQQAMQSGAVAFLSKPFNDEELFQAVRLAQQEEFATTKTLISVVDDDESVLRTTTLLIESYGFRAAAFASAESFLKSDQLHDTSCLILDVRMPDMNGLELQTELAAAGHDIPVIFITAYDDKGPRGRAMQAGAIAFLDKPFSDEQLLQTVRSALSHGDDGSQSAD